MISKKWKDRLQVLRDKKQSLGFTNENLVNITGLTHNTIATIFAGSRCPSMESYIVICEALGLEAFS
jgi:predicted transcriptional regulator